MDVKSINCTIKQAVHMRVGDHKVDFHSGCSVIDVSFPNTFYVEVQEINFKNFYAAQVSLMAKIKETPAAPSSEVDLKWTQVVRKMQLMPHPHCDNGAEDYFCIPLKQLPVPLQNVVALRFVLRQPSPVWKEFRIEDIKLYKHPLQATPELSLPGWMVEAQKSQEDHIDRQLKGVPSINTLSRDLQQLWALTSQTFTNQTRTTLGRYDVEGSYEINLLSYT